MPKVAKRFRSPRWSPTEIQTLIDSIEEMSSDILGTLVPSHVKQEAWRVVTLRVNAVNVCGVERTRNQVEHKWWDLKGATKRSNGPWKNNSVKNQSTKQLKDTQIQIMRIIESHSSKGITKVEPFNKYTPTEVKIQDGELPVSLVDSSMEKESSFPLEVQLTNDNNNSQTKLNETTATGCGRSMFDMYTGSPVPSDDLSVISGASSLEVPVEGKHDDDMLQVQKQILKEVRELARSQNERNSIEKQKLKLLRDSLNSVLQLLLVQLN